jgi:OmpA-OmpF porin, OOP family
MILKQTCALLLSLSALAAIPHQATAQSAPTPGATIDIERLPVVKAQVPPYPFIDYPDTMPENRRRAKESPFDAIDIIVGNKIRTVEGRIAVRKFGHKVAQLSELMAQRDYDKAIRAIGGVKVNAVNPDDKVLREEFGSRTKITKQTRAYSNGSYDAYLINKPEGRAWMILMVSSTETTLIAVEEKQVSATVKLVTADSMKKELDANGRVALYINFDTDKASVRPDGKPVVDQIATLLNNNAALALSIEGHTDASGDARRNKTLSTQRAQAVAAMLKDAGIAQSRLSATGHGADKPLGPNTDEAGRARNRRVELVKVARN